MGFIKEFRDFAIRGNVIDLAVGIIIGAAFGTIVNSLVADIIMPVIGVVTGGVDFSGLKTTVGAAEITYGKFIQAVFVFTLTAFALFIIIRAMNSVKKKEEAAPAPPAQTAEEKLLAEIRDLLKQR